MAASSNSVTTANAVDELLFQNDAVSLCLLVNRRHQTLRVIDFRAGPTLAKRNFVLAAAKREGVEKVFTLVERDEVNTWTRLGFTREGSIPSFYKRSDAWILGAVVSQVGPIRAESDYDDDDDFDDQPGEDSDSPAAALAERTIQKAKRLLKDGVKLPPVKLSPAKKAQTDKALVAAQKAGVALTGFEPFGRDAEREHFVITAKGGFELHVSWELQPCFGNSFFELMTGPQTDSERLTTIAAIGTVCDRLKELGAVSTFTLAPADDIGLAVAFLANGFRRSAVLARHIVIGGDRKDAIVWSRKLVVAEA